MAELAQIIYTHSRTGVQIPIIGVGDDPQRLVNWPVFANWFSRYETTNEAIISNIEVFKHTYKGKSETILFSFINANASRRDNSFVPGVTLVSPHAVSVAPLIEAITDDGTSTGLLYMPYVEQFRMAALGRVVESAAGMIDGEGIFTGPAMQEFTELIKKTAQMEGLQELNLFLSSGNMIPLTPYYTSVGRTNEVIYPFAAFFKMPLRMIQAMMNVTRGEIQEGEQLKVKIGLFDDVVRMGEIADGKLLVLEALVTRLRNSRRF